LARSFFSQEGVAHSEANRNVCEQCSGLEVWRANFEINRRVGELAKSSECSLCMLLSTIALTLKLGAIDNIRCSWEGAKLRISCQDETRYLELATFLEPPSAGLAFFDGDEEIAKHQAWLLKSAQLGHPSLPPPGSPEQYKLLRYWLQLCDTHHDHGRSRSQQEHNLRMPTRLIYMGRSELRLETSHSSSVRYAALSHRWGDGPPFCTLDSNLDELCREIPFELLPRNFQDAIRVTRSLGLSYLWIDSLCIIQKNEEDWNREAARMGDVFSNAYCTIAASSATSSVQGFLSRPHQLPLFATLPGPGSARFHVSECLEDFHRDVETAPLNTRGWVFQERALSRRTLHFTSNQVYWECGNGVHSERLIKLTKYVLCPERLTYFPLTLNSPKPSCSSSW
jgi:heterokaryon incompatibility protein (HET)